jgi:hypothetical protein
VYIGKVCIRKYEQQQHGTVNIVLALANRNDPICVALPMVAKESKNSDCRVSVLQAFLPLKIANGNTA